VDPGFWFGRGTGRGPGERKSSSRVQRQSHSGGLGAKPQNPKEYYVMRLKKPLTKRKNKSIQTDIV